MPKLNYTPPFIEVELNDRVYNDTLIKQKARFVRLSHTQDERGAIVEIEFLVTLFASDNGNYGEQLAGAGFQPYRKVLYAENDTIVNAKNGEVLRVRNYPVDTDALWQSYLDEDEQVVMPQGDFFVMLRETQEIKISDMIRAYALQANQLNKFQ